jgi:hypothetical protein
MRRVAILVIGSSAAALVATAAGCMFIDDFDQFSVATDLTCVDGVLRDAPTMESLDTTLGTDDYEGSCGGAGAPDLAFQWTAPRTDFYRFHTTGSDFETVLYLRDGDCDAEELACSEEQDGPFRSEIVEYMEVGRRVVAVVDGRAGDRGIGVLQVDPVDCPGVQLTDAILPVEHTTVGRDPYEGATCVNGEHGARTYRFTAPSDGNYSFLAVRGDASFRPAILLEDGPACGAPWMQCNSGEDGRAEVLRYLTEGQHITVIVAGRSGDGPFTLSVEREGGSSCIDDDVGLPDFLDPPVPYAGTLPKDGPHRMTTSCGHASVWDYMATNDPDNVRPLPDANVLVTALPPSGNGCSEWCDPYITASFPFFAALSELDAEGQCASHELFCGEGATSDPWADPPVYELLVPMPRDGVTRLLTIDRDLVPDQGVAVIDTSQNDFTVEYWCFAIC